MFSDVGGSLISISSRTFDANAANTRALDHVIARFPDAQVQSEAEFLRSQEGAIQSQLNLLYILLALSVIVSLFGIVNTLVLTVFVSAILVGLFAAILPARRAARLDILPALQYE